MQEQHELPPTQRVSPSVMPLAGLIHYVSSPVFTAVEKQQAQTNYFTQLASQAALLR